MKEYQLNRINETMRGISIVLILPLFFGGITIVHAWNYPFWGNFGLMLTIFSILVMAFCYYRTYEKFTVKINADTLIIINKKSKNERRVNTEDIAFIKYDKSAALVVSTNQPYKEEIAIISKAGKTVFFCSNNYNFTEFHNFFNDIRNLINGKERFIYAKRIKMTKLYRYLYINPLYENTSLVNRKTRQAGFYYWMILLVLLTAILMIALNLFIIYRHGGFVNCILL